MPLVGGFECLELCLSQPDLDQSGGDNTPLGSARLEDPALHSLVGLRLTSQLDSALRGRLQHLPAVGLYHLPVDDEGGGGEGGDVFPQEAHRVPTLTGGF